jgi:curved DNA-binding protein CbpA
MNYPDPKKDYYFVLGVPASASKAEVDRQYKRLAAQHHPDLGGNEERMKLLNEAYGVLKDQASRRAYDLGRKPATGRSGFAPVSTPAARDVGVFGHCLSACLCLMSGIFLLLLVRFQWMWFLWPLAVLAIFVLGFGVLMARSAMVALNAALPVSNPWRKHTRLQEIGFWMVIVTGGFGIYWLIA